jgi:hypothetical protein
MGAKLNSKTHLLNRFFDFWRRVLRVWLQSLKKKFFGKNQKRYKKTQNFMLISNLLKIFTKIHKKVISETSLTNMSKSGKSEYFRHIFANNFFL